MAHSGKTMTFATDLVPQEDNIYSLGTDDLKWIIRGSLPLSDITGADDLKAIEAISGTAGLLKKTAANTWTLDTNTYLTSHQSLEGYKTRKVKSKSLTSAGWYRILDCTNYSMAFFITFYGSYNNQPPTPVTFLVSHAYNTTKIEQIGRSANVGWIQQLRAVHHDTSKFYIDVYYAGTKANIGAFEITPLDPNARSNITLIDFTAITDSITANASCETTLESHADIADTATSATKSGVATIWLYPENNNEINFGGTSTSTTLYIGYRTKDSRPIPTKFIFGSSTGTADLQAKTIYLGSGTSSYISSTQYTGNAATATAANLTSTANAVAYYTNTTGTFSSKASANGALYATSANGALQWGTLPIAQGGTGVTSFTKNQVILSDNTNGTTGLTSRAYSDSASAGALSSTSTNFVTERDIYYGLPTLNNAHNYNSSSTYYAPTAGGTAGYTLIGAGTTTAPVWYGGTVMSGSAAASWKTAFNGTTDATASNAAAVTIAGGLGIAKSIIVGETATITNDTRSPKFTLTVNDADKAYLQYNTTDNSIDFIFV